MSLFSFVFNAAGLLNLGNNILNSFGVMQPENPQPWVNPGEDPPMQEMNSQPWANPGDDTPTQDMNAQPWVPANATNPSSAMANTWGIYDQDGNAVFDVDSCVDFKFSDSAKVSDFPVEQGAFASYNKVIHPFQPKIRLAVGGKDRIAALLVALADAVRSTDIYTVFTPEISYSNVMVEKYDYTRTATKGRNLLTVEVTLMEVIQVSAQYTTVKIPAPKKPASGDKKVGGKAQATQPANPPTIEQQNAAMAKQLGIPPASVGVHA